MRNLAIIALCMFTLAGSAEAAPCPVGLEVEVDFDFPGSGYSETTANWKGHAAIPLPGCQTKTYRYLTSSAGDGTRKGTATWKPTITVAGWYDVTVHFPASENRNPASRYELYSDGGHPMKVKIVDQVNLVKNKYGNTIMCKTAAMGQIYCAPGGNCRVFLDGMTTSKSDGADLTVFRLAKCSGTTPPPPPNPCDGIAKAGFEVCKPTQKTCAGVFLNGEGCNALCAAAGMVCVARFGGSPGCNKESHNVWPCGAVNGHKDDYCECEFPPGTFPDAGTPTPDAGVPPTPDAQVPPPPPTPDAGVVVDAQEIPADAGVVVDHAGPRFPDGGGQAGNTPGRELMGACSVSGAGPPLVALLLLGLARSWRRRS